MSKHDGLVFRSRRVRQQREISDYRAKSAQRALEAIETAFAEAREALSNPFAADEKARVEALLREVHAIVRAAGENESRTGGWAEVDTRCVFASFRKL